MNRINRIRVSGYKSIRDQEIDLRPITVLIGANGSGKSNLVSVFRMLNFTMSGSLQLFVGRSGGADSILYYGARTTPVMEAEFEFETDQGVNHYQTRLVHAAGDTLIFADELIRFHRHGRPEPEWVSLGAGHKESALQETAKKSDSTATMARTLAWLMERWRAYQFHDTSPESAIRQKRYINDAGFLRDDAGNLAPFLYGLRSSHPDHYDRIRSTIQLALPFFDDFILEPTAVDQNYIVLDWKERGSDYRFGPHQIADGALRFMALTTLLLQPEDKMASAIIIDEPELGLHPYALSLLGSLINGVATSRQVVVATQSSDLVDQFRADDITVVDRREEVPVRGRGSQWESVFRRQSSKELEEWLKEYTVSELWDKNVIAGRPHG